MSQANTTLNATTQRLVCSALLPLSCRYRADRMYEQPRICSTIYTNAMGGRHKSLDGNKYAQVFANDSFFAVSYPMDKKSSAGQALKQFIADFSIPDRIVCDGLGEQTGKRTEFTVTARKHGIDIHLTEPDQHNQSKVEGVIRELSKRWFWVMLKQWVPNRLWDYGIHWVCEIMQCTASNSGRLRGRTPLEQLTGETPDISEYLDFSFYDWCWYNDNAGLGETKFGRWLGVSHHVGSLMLERSRVRCLLTRSLNYDMIMPKTIFMCLLCDFMTFVICLLCFHSFVFVFMFCCVDLFPQEQIPHTTHRSLHFYWESSANYRYQLPRVVPS